MVQPASSVEIETADLMARPQQRMLLRPQPALGVLLLLALLAGRAADAFTLSCFRGKDSSAGTGAAAYCAHQRPLPGTDAFAQVSRNREEAFWKLIKWSVSPSAAAAAIAIE